jgi:prepilin-type N-terminal cleavage/methylation domain-containing protein
MFSYLHTFFAKKPKGTPNSKRGFTLIELLVVVAIIVIIASITVFNYSASDAKTTLEGIAHTMDIMLRQAQVYATSVKQYTPASGQPNFKSAYGIYFDKDNISNGYIFFARQPDNINDAIPTYNNAPTNQYTGDGTTCTASDNCIQKIKFNNNYFVREICATGVLYASCGITVLNVLYTKNSLNPILIGKEPAGTGFNEFVLTDATIKISTRDRSQSILLKILPGGATSIQ